MIGPIVTFALILGAPQAPPSTVAETEPSVRSLGGETVKVAFTVPDEEVAARAGEELRIVVDGLTLVHPGAIYHVYLNLPAEREPDPEGPYFLGNLAIFGEVGEVGEDDPESTRTFDAGAAIERLRERGEWTGEVELTFVRANPPAAVGPAAAAPPEPDEFLRFRRVALVRG